MQLFISSIYSNLRHMEENSPDMLWWQKAQKTCRKRHRRYKALQIGWIPAEEWKAEIILSNSWKNNFFKLVPLYGTTAHHDLEHSPLKSVLTVSHPHQPLSGRDIHSSKSHKVVLSHQSTAVCHGISQLGHRSDHSQMSLDRTARDLWGRLWRRILWTLRELFFSMQGHQGEVWKHPG